jgi:hypothetical protein
MIEAIVLTILTTIGTVIITWARRLPTIERARFFSHILTPIALLGYTMYSGGWIALGFEKSGAIAELKTEISTSGATSTKSGFVLIAEPVDENSKYVIPITNGTSKFWISLDETAAGDVAKNFDVISSGLQVTNPLVISEPFILVGEGKLGDSVLIPPNHKELLQDWRLTSKRSLALVATVLFGCFLAVGMGVVTGFPSVNPDENNAGEVGTKPDKKRVIKGNAKYGRTRKVGVGPRSQPNRKKIPRVDKHS